MGITKPKVLVVGANGYIGSNLSRRLIDLGYEIRLSDLSKDSLIDCDDYFQVDFSKTESIPGLLEDIDVVYFFAGKTGNSEEGFNHPDNFIVGNEITLVNLLNVVKEMDKKPKIIFPSTRLIYKGILGELITEESEIDPKSIYAVNKLACEKFLEIYHTNFDIDYSIFRISLPYGTLVEQRHVSYGVMSFLINRAKEGKELFVYGEGTQKGSLIHIKDLVEILVAGGMSNETRNEVFNVGGPDHLEMGYVVRSIASKFNVPVSQVEWPGVSEKTDQGDLVFSSDKLINRIKYTYTNNFSKWLNQTDL